MPPHTYFAALAEFHDQIEQYLTTSKSRAQQVGLQLREYEVMLAIKANTEGNAPPLGTLAKKLRIDRGELVELLPSLVRRGFVKRERDTSDRRRVLISLTPAGEEWLVSLTEDVRLNLSKSGIGLFRALRGVLAHAAPSAVPAQAVASRNIDLDAWRSSAPQVV